MVFSWVALSGAAQAAGPVVRGAGATFPAPLYERWAVEYRRLTGVEVSFEAIGSGRGVERIEGGLVDFGASDEPMPLLERRRLGIVQFPIVVGGVVPVVNITGIKPGGLRLSGSVLANIYLGKIRKWNDPAITELNPEITMPSSNITVVHRADPSGTSFLWSSFLAASNAQWKTQVGVGKILAWPTGVAAVGNEGVASSVQRTRVAIGYVEYAYATKHNLPFVSVQNLAGSFVAAGKASFEAAAGSMQWKTAADLEQPLIDPNCAACWPISGSSFILIRRAADRPRQTLRTLQFFDWALKHGQQAAAELDYATMPDPARALIERLWTDEMTEENSQPVYGIAPDKP